MRSLKGLCRATLLAGAFLVVSFCATKITAWSSVAARFVAHAEHASQSPSKVVASATKCEAHGDELFVGCTGFF